MMLSRLALVCASLGFAAGCNVPIRIDVGVGPIDYELAATQFTIPDALRDSSNNTVRRVPCNADADCQAVGVTSPVLRCVAAACDPDPVTFEMTGDVIDLTGDPTVSRFGDRLNAVLLRSASFAATPNGFQTAIGPTAVYWGPANATSISSPGVMRLGTIPVVDLSSGTETGGAVDLDPNGVLALSNHLVGVERRFRLLLQPSVDLGPGLTFPAGSVRLRVQMLVQIEGVLVR